MSNYSYDYPRPALTVDCVVFGWEDPDLKVLLIQRDKEPFAGKWALPGGFVGKNEKLARAAERELEEETGISGAYLEQLFSMGDPGRDPRGWVVSVAYYALVAISENPLTAATDARDARWFDLDALPPLAFDHDRIYEMARERLRGKVRYVPVGFELLPEKFSLSQLQRLYEAILGEGVDKRNFRKKLLGMGLLTELDEVEPDVPYRAAKLFRFENEKYHTLVREGFQFKM